MCVGALDARARLGHAECSPKLQLKEDVSRGLHQRTTNKHRMMEFFPAQRPTSGLMEAKLSGIGGIAISLVNRQCRASVMQEQDSWCVVVQSRWSSSFRISAGRRNFSSTHRSRPSVLPFLLLRMFLLFICYEVFPCSFLFALLVQGCSI